MKPDHICVNHPSVEATSVCRHCHDWFCSRCIKEGPEGYFCNKPECLQALETLQAYYVERKRKAAVGKLLTKDVVIGFWKRLWSDILDTLILAILGFVLIIPLSIFTDIGEDGVWIGLIICFLYNGILQSSLGEGQSYAKRWLNIQVVRLDGKFLSMPRSFLRYSVIAFIAYNGVFGSILGNLFPGATWLNTPFVCFVVILFLGCILMVPIHPLKRGIHDILAGSIVVKKDSYQAGLIKIEDKQRSRVYWAYGVWIVSSLVVLVVGGAQWSRLFKNDPLIQAASKVQQAVVENTQFQNVKVSVTTNTVRPFSGLPKTTVSLVIDGHLKSSIRKDTDLKEQEVQKALQQAIKTYPYLNKMNEIVISTRGGVDVGIANFKTNDKEEFGTDGKKLGKNTDANFKIGFGGEK